jgi:hypothetical protein
MDLESKLDAMESYLRRLALVQDRILTEIILLKEKQSTQTPAAPTFPKPAAELYARAKLLRCPKCGSGMSVRQRKSNGNPFFGCNAFNTGCNGLLSADEQPDEKDVEAMERLSKSIERKPGGPVRLAGFNRTVASQVNGSNFTKDDSLNESVPF